MAFEHDGWIRANEAAKWNIRQKMAQDLIDNHTLDGKYKSEIFRMLGKPEEYSNIPSNELYYTIDLYYGTDIDPIRIEYLIISLDQDDKVANYKRERVLDK